VALLASADDRLNLLSLAVLSGVTGQVCLLLRSCAARRGAIPCPGHDPQAIALLSPDVFVPLRLAKPLACFLSLKLGKYLSIYG
jgi:hypothetical protein